MIQPSIYVCLLETQNKTPQAQSLTKCEARAYRDYSR